MRYLLQVDDTLELLFGPSPAPKAATGPFFVKSLESLTQFLSSRSVTARFVADFQAVGRGRVAAGLITQLKWGLRS